MSSSAGASQSGASVATHLPQPMPLHLAWATMLPSTRLHVSTQEVTQKGHETLSAMLLVAMLPCTPPIAWGHPSFMTSAPSTGEGSTL